MIRYSIFIATILGTAATAIAAVHPMLSEAPSSAQNVTVIRKTSAFPVYGPVAVEECAKEDCSDVNS